MKPLLYVDGYNVIGAWPQAQRENWPLDVCRDRLIHLLEDYAGYSGQEVWLVFDGYRTDRTLRTVDERDGLTVVYTRHGETADHYIDLRHFKIGIFQELYNIRLLAVRPKIRIVGVDAGFVHIGRPYGLKYMPKMASKTACQTAGAAK